MKSPMTAAAAFLSLIAAMGCGGDNGTVEMDIDADTTAQTPTEEMHPLGLYEVTEGDPEDGGAGVVHSGAFLILEDARSTVDEANESIRQLETSLEDIR